LKIAFCPLTVMKSRICRSVILGGSSTRLFIGHKTNILVLSTLSRRLHASSLIIILQCLRQSSRIWTSLRTVQRFRPLGGPRVANELTALSYFAFMGGRWRIFYKPAQCLLIDRWLVLQWLLGRPKACYGLKLVSFSQYAVLACRPNGKLHDSRTEILRCCAVRSAHVSLL